MTKTHYISFVAFGHGRSYSDNQAVSRVEFGCAYPKKRTRNADLVLHRTRFILSVIVKRRIK